VVKHYNYLNQPGALPYVNNGDNFVVVIGANFAAIGTITANASIVLLEVKDAASTVVDLIAVDGSNYIAVPTTGGTLIILQMAKKLLVPPGGSVVSPGPQVSNIQIVECLNTFSVDGRDSLENALAIL
jgi:hypothetical protein